MNLSYELRKRGKHDEAVAALRTAIRIKPGYARAHCNLGSCLGEQGKIDEAVAEFRTAIRLNHELADAHYNLGSAERHRGTCTRRAGRRPCKSSPITPTLTPISTRARATGKDG